MAKCVDCGFLALRLIHPDSAETAYPAVVGLAEADQGFRSTGKIPRIAPPPTRGVLHGTRQVYADRPVCFVQADDYSTDGDGILALLQRDRSCEPANTPWHQGFSPKEHQEMLDRKELLEWQERREDKDKIWRSDERTRDNRWRAGELVVLITGVIIAIFALRGGGGDTINNYSAATPITSSTPVTIRTP